MKPLPDIETIESAWAAAERTFAINGYNGKISRIGGRKRTASSRLLFTAPHAVNHYLSLNDDEVKHADLYTGGLARTLAFATGSAVAYHSSRQPGINPRNGATPVDDAIMELSERHPRCFAIDLHGCRDSQGFDIAIGTGGPIQHRQQLVTDIIAGEINRLGLSLAINPIGYNGQGQFTMVKRHRDRPSLTIVQLEIARWLREPDSSDRQLLLNLLTMATTRIGDI